MVPAGYVARARNHTLTDECLPTFIYMSLDLGKFNVYNESTKTDIEAPKPRVLHWRKYGRLLWPAWFLDHLNRASLKTILPTFIQVWLTVIISVIPATSHWIGTACYLLQIVGFICASGGLLVSLNILLSLVCFLYAVVGWLFVVVALAIATRIRGWPSTDSVAKILIDDGSCSPSNISQCMIQQFYTGRFLETRCTAVFVVALIMGITLFGLTGKLHPLARQPYVIGTISLIINTCYTVFYPVFLPKDVGYTLIKPFGLAFAMKILLSVFVFPTTSNSTYFAGVIRVLEDLRSVNFKNGRMMLTIKPSHDSFLNYQLLMKDIQAIRIKVPPLDLFLSTIWAEVSYGRLDGGDASDIRSVIKPFVNTIAGYEYFYLLFQERKEIALSELVHSARRGSMSSETFYNGESAVLRRFAHRYKEVGVFEKSQKVRLLNEKLVSRDSKEKITLGDLDFVADHISNSHSDFFIQTNSALDSIIKWIHEATSYRAWSLLDSRGYEHRQKECHSNLLDARAKFQSVLSSLQSTALTQEILQSQSRSDEQTLCLLSQTSLFLFLSNQVGKQILRMMDVLLRVDERRPQPQLITFWNAPHNKRPHFARGLLNDDPTDVSRNGLRQNSEPRNPDSLDPTTPLQIFMLYLSRFYGLLMNEHFLFWVRSGILVAICCVPYFCRTTAHWYFEKRLIWLPIMCGVSTSEFTAESVYVFCCKLVYSFLGVIAGLIAWYISTGLGKGNYYGYCVVTAILYFILCYYRHFALHLSKIPGIMITVTPTLVLGTSWVDAKYNHLANIGYGWKVALVRFISVVVGLIMALLASTFPKPKSSKVAVRKSLANVLEQTCDLQCIVSNFALQRMEDPSTHILDHHDHVSDEIRTLLLTLAHVKGLMNPIQYEVPLSGEWPVQKYTQLHSLITDIVLLYFLLYNLVDQVDDTDTWMPHIIRRAGWSEPLIIQKLGTLVFMCSETLRLKGNLPQIAGSNISFSHLDYIRRLWGAKVISLSDRFYDDKEEDGNGSQIKLKAPDYARLLSRDGQLEIVCLLLSHMVYERADDVLLVVKGLVGEKFPYNMNLFDI